MSVPKPTAVRRSLRRFTLGSGPLKRVSDRIQLIGRLLVVLSFLVAPPLAVAAATVTATHLSTVAAQEASERTHTRAVLLVDAPPPSTANVENDGYSSARVPARAVWPIPGGSSRRGTVLAEPLTPAGTSVPIWLDRRGEVTRPPLDAARIPAAAALTGALLLVGAPLAVWSAYVLLCATLDARRDRRWSEEWATVEPVWNPRLL
jgi:hypothetical protein